MSICEVCFEMVPEGDDGALAELHSHEATLELEAKCPEVSVAREALVTAAKLVVAQNEKRTATGFTLQMKAYVEAQQVIRSRHWVEKIQPRLEAGQNDLGEVWGAFEAMRCEVADLRKSQDAELKLEGGGEKRPAVEDYKSKVQLYLDAFKAGCEAASSTARPPWRASFLVETLSAKSIGTIEFEGGVITDKDGNLLWDTVCEYCGLVVQRGAFGHGVERIVRHNQGCISCVQCFESLTKIAPPVADEATNTTTTTTTTPGPDSDPAFHFAPPESGMDIVEVSDQVSLRVDMLRDTYHLGHMVRKSLTTFYKDRPCIGKMMSSGGDTEDHYKWLTYGELGSMCDKFAEFLHTSVRPRIISTQETGSGTPPSHPLMGISSQNRAEFLVADVASVYAGFIEVGIHTTYLEEELAELIQHNGLSAMVCDYAQAQVLGALMANPKFSAATRSITTVICMDAIEDGHSSSAKTHWNGFPSHVEVTTMPEIFTKPVAGNDYTFLQDGQDTPMAPGKTEWNYWKPTTQNQKSASAAGAGEEQQLLEETPNLFSIIYTSGSTGSPKGCLTTEPSFRHDVSHGLHVFPLVTISYIPLSHSTDRMRVYETLLNGGRVGFASYAHSNWEDHELATGAERFGLLRAACKKNGSDNGVWEILRDVAELRPTIFIAPPRVWKGLQFLFGMMLQEERKNKTNTGEGGEVGPASPEEEAAALRQIVGRLFGTRVQHCATGGGPTDASTFDFVKKGFNLDLLESFGCTEGGAIAVGMKGPGGFMSVVEGTKVRLAPSSGGEGSPYYGELLVHTPTLSLGYWRNPAQTEASFVMLPEVAADDEEGDPVLLRWFRTGDLCEVKRGDPREGEEAAEESAEKETKEGEKTEDANEEKEEGRNDPHAVITSCRVKDRKKAVVTNSVGVEVSLEDVEARYCHALSHVGVTHCAALTSPGPDTRNPVVISYIVFNSAFEPSSVLEALTQLGDEIWVEQLALPPVATSLGDCAVAEVQSPAYQENNPKKDEEGGRQRYIIDPSPWTPSPSHRLRGLLTVSLKVNRAAVAVKFGLEMAK